MASQSRILIVEDDPDVQLLMHALLKERGYHVTAVESGGAMSAVMKLDHFDLVLLDLGLPDEDGLVLARWIRSNSDTPFVVITARQQREDRMTALELGADDYLVKPFHVQELLARLKALVRRAEGQFKPLLNYGSIQLDARGKWVKIGGDKVDLTAYEYNLLEFLMLHSGEVVSKTELTEHLYDQDFDRDSNVIEVFVGRLRKKLDPDNSLKPIETLRGQGYRFSLEEA